jgi:tetratricopeptide (TPR) repeat protein
MAFGFGFNKQKALSAAEKYVQQGKMQNAIAEYEKVIKADPKDLTVTNTVGDLYSRLGDADKATECFKTVGDAYANQGFTVKAIAMYKKISKLKPSLESVLKLAELYTQQGLFNDARSQYLQVADEFLKAGELDNAVRIFQKILEMDPENTAMRVRLAEVYVRLGKKDDAWQIFSAAAETLRSKGSLSGADEVLQRMLTLDPGNSYALRIQGRNQLEAGDSEAAIESLQKVSDLDSNPDALRDLLKAYLKTGKLSEAGLLASKLLTVHNDLPAISTFADALMQAGQYENALQVYDQHAERLLAEDSEKVLKNLHSIIGHVRDNSASLEKLLDLFQKAGESTHVSEVIELLAHSSVQSGDLTRARDLYQKLTTVEPGNPLHLNNYQQVVRQLGGDTAGNLISAEEAAVIVDELEATAPSIPQHYSDAVALAVRSALTDAELFISYNMPAKALGPLMAALPQAPTDQRLNQRLAALHTRAARFAEAGVCCRTLQNIYSEAGHPEEATRYGELATRYEGRSAVEAPAASVSAVAAAAPQTKQASAPWPVSEPAEVAEAAEFALVADPSPELPEAAVPDQVASADDSTAAGATEEIDLSSEWDDALTIEADDATPGASEDEAVEAAPVAAAAKLGQKANDPEQTAETVEEIRFYLEHGMAEQASAIFEKLQSLTDDESILTVLRAEIEAASKKPVAAEETSAVESISDFSIDEPAVEAPAEFAVDEVAVAEVDSPAAVEPVAASAKQPEPVVESAPPPALAKEAAPEAKPGALGEFVAELESSLGEGFVPEKAAPQLANESAQPASTQAAALQASAESNPTEHPSQELEAVGQAAPTVFGVREPEVMGEFVADLEASLGEDFLKGAPVVESQLPPPAPVEAQAPAVTLPPPVPVAPPVVAPLAAAAAASASPVASLKVPVAASRPQSSPIILPAATAAPKSSPFGEEAGVDLSEMFGEIKHDLEAGGPTAADEDPETHYNLGIAFREMGLLDEAIGELQKTCQAVDRGHAFPQVMQTYTWLAQCFLDKGVPQAAIRWYDKALQAPGIDEETRTALHYELATAYELAGDRPAAMKNFMEVYGRNIDYRDVAERIKPLKS